MISAHIQFLIAYVIAMLITLPLLIAAWRKRLPHVRLTIVGGVVGYGIIGLTFVIDSVRNPPLFFHGFIPGIGIGILLVSLLIFARDLYVLAHSCTLFIQGRWLIAIGASSLLVSGILHLWFVGAVFVFYTGIFAGLPLGLGITYPVLRRVRYR